MSPSKIRKRKGSRRFEVGVWIRIRGHDIIEMGDTVCRVEFALVSWAGVCWLGWGPLDSWFRYATGGAL